MSRYCGICILFHLHEILFNLRVGQSGERALEDRIWVFALEFLRGAPEVGLEVVDYC